MSELEQKIYLARVAEQCERHEDMCRFLKVLLEKKEDLTNEERNLLSVGYKHIIGSRRNAYRTIQAISQQPKYSEYAGQLEDYKKKVVKEAADICDDLVKIIDNDFIPKASNLESEGFFNKMKGDYYRYLAEVSEGAQLEEVKEKALTAYKAASVAVEDLATSQPSHPVRLGLALNFSVFYYEIMNNQEEAIAMAKKTFDDAIGGLDDLKEEDYNDAALIMKLLRDNIKIWTSNDEEEEGAKPEA